MIQKVLRWRAEDSPNVRLAITQILAGKRKPEALLIRTPNRPWGAYTEAQFKELSRRWEASGRTNPPEEILVRGVLSFSLYLNRRALWDAQKQCEGLDAQFYEGTEIKLFPEAWMEYSAKLAQELRSKGGKRQVLAIGCDSGQGQANTSWSMIDELGLIEIESRKTLDTSKVVGHTIRLIEDLGVDPGKVGFDSGGGGQQHVDQLRDRGYQVRSIQFGEAPQLELRRGLHQLTARKEIKEERYVYKNKRVQMYHELSQAINPDPEINPNPFAIPDTSPIERELHRQLMAHPKLEDSQGRYILPPKQKDQSRKDDSAFTMLDRLGCSPDEADSLVVAYHVLHHRSSTVTLQVF
ncbi:MAG: hypothetical protein QXZ57_06975 [Nitrososphaerota archaeon]